MEFSKEMISKARWMADMMHADGLTPEMLTDPAVLQDAVEAYAEEMGRRIEKMQTHLITNPQAMKDFRSTVYDMTVAENTK